MQEAFRRLATTAARLTGSMAAFTVAVVVVVVWGVTGFFVGFSDTWQLVINTATTIVTFLMVFLIQNTQNRDSHALHAKLNELVVHLQGADNRIVEAEDLSEEELAHLKDHFSRLAEHSSGSSSRNDNPPAANSSR